MGNGDGTTVAAVVDRYGPPDVVRLAEVAMPRPRPGEVVVEVAATAVTSGDARIRGARFPPGFGPFARLAFGVRGPRRPVLGGVVSGTVVALGDDGASGTPVRLGDRVCAMTGTRMGAHAGHVVVRSAQLVRLPGSISHEQAAGVLFGGTTAAHFLRRVGERRAKVGRGIDAQSSVLVIGASGAVGTNVVQLAAAGGARVIAVCSAANADLVGDLGADEVLDRHRIDVRGVVDRYDVVIDTVGALGAVDGRRLLAPDGVLVLVSAGLGDTVRARGDVIAGPAPERTDDMSFLLDEVDGGRLRVVIEDVLPLDAIVEAHRRVDSGHKVGNLLIRPTTS